MSSKASQSNLAWAGEQVVLAHLKACKRLRMTQLTVMPSAQGNDENSHDKDDSNKGHQTQLIRNPSWATEQNHDQGKRDPLVKLVLPSVVPSGIQTALGSRTSSFINFHRRLEQRRKAATDGVSAIAAATGAAAAAASAVTN